jgi:hypothetical protein
MRCMFVRAQIDNLFKARRASSLLWIWWADPSAR